MLLSSWGEVCPEAWCISWGTAPQHCLAVLHSPVQDFVPQNERNYKKGQDKPTILNWGCSKTEVLEQPQFRKI
jgi:hypothetical protein